MSVGDLANTKWRIKKPSEIISGSGINSTAFNINSIYTVDSYSVFGSALHLRSTADLSSIYNMMVINTDITSSASCEKLLLLSTRTTSGTITSADVSYQATAESASISAGDIETILEITGGTDCANNQLINWLETNATRIIEPGMLDGWFIKGTMNNWEAKQAYNFLLSDEEKPAGYNHQYVLTVDLAKDDEFKIHLLASSTWLGYSSFENSGAISNFENDATTSNIKVLISARYRFYLKEINGSYQIYVTDVPVSSGLQSGFSIVKLSANTLTINGVSYNLVGDTVGSDLTDDAFKLISAAVDSDNIFTLNIGSATFTAEDYSSETNFIFADDTQLELADGLLFEVSESVAPANCLLSNSGDAILSNDGSYLLTTEIS